MSDALTRTVSDDVREKIILETALYVADRVSAQECGSPGCGARVSREVLETMHALADGFNAPYAPLLSRAKRSKRA